MNTRAALNHFLYRLGLRPEPGPRRLMLDGSLRVELEKIAADERREIGEVAGEIISRGIERHLALMAARRTWDTLTRRERDAAGLVVLGYTNRQIGGRLGVSVETAKVHVANALEKFGLHDRVDLRRLLGEWDWSEWEDPDHPPEEE